MRQVVWTDRNGYKHRSLIRDTDSDDAAPTGILQDPPSLEGIDWEAVKRDLHNGLVDAGLSSWREVQHHGGLPGIVLGCLRTRVITLYREDNREVSNG